MKSVVFSIHLLVKIGFAVFFNLKGASEPLRPPVCTTVLYCFSAVAAMVNKILKKSQKERKRIKMIYWFWWRFIVVTFICFDNPVCIKHYVLHFLNSQTVQ